MRRGGVASLALTSLPGWIAAVMAGAAADAAGVPLAWVLGPMLAAAAFSIGGSPPFAPTEARRFGQLIVGTAIGLNMTTAAALQMPFWLPAMVAVALLSMLLAALLSRALARLAQVDHATAYFALLPGGLSEMANTGAGHGARPEAVSLSHALRVALAVLLLPWAVSALDGGPGLAGAAVKENAGLGLVLLLAAAGLAGVWLLRQIRLANTWMLGPLAAAAILSGSGLVQAQLPVPLMWLGQYLIGLAIGIRFRRDILARLPRFGLTSALATLVLGLLMAAGAFLLRFASGVDAATLVLAVSPGGFAEMALTAKALDLDVALVTGFHFVRAFTVNALAGALWQNWVRRWQRPI